MPTYEELNAAIDQLADLLKKYLHLAPEGRRARGRGPVHQYDWKASFRVARLRD